MVASATLENLFGSLDYCDCQDCGSILGPAAYLVDLLHYVDQPSPAGGLSNPQDILFGRRPDLQYLPLTCANTNTALPYIDLVNEALEYFVANGFSIAGYQGHDTDPAITSAELLASPQYVNDAAYAVAAGRLLPAAAAVQPAAGAAPAAHERAGRRAAGRDDGAAGGRRAHRHRHTGQLRLVRHPHRAARHLPRRVPAVHRPVPGARRPVGDHRLPDRRSPTCKAMSLRDFSRRLGVSYDDLALIIQTQFINPNAVLIPRLTRLNVPFTTLKTLHDTLNTPSSIDGQLHRVPAGRARRHRVRRDQPDRLRRRGRLGHRPGHLPADHGHHHDHRTRRTPRATAPAPACCCATPTRTITANQLTAADFTRLIRFVRLWQKLVPLLGDPSDTVSIQHTDDILAALYPATPASAEAGFETLLTRLGFLAAVMRQLSLTGGASLGQLLACWAPIGTAAPGSLYQAMFLTPALLQQDPGAQTATVGPVLSDGDVLTTAINNTKVSSYTVVPGDTPAQIAATITQAINAATVADPVTGLAVNSRFHATTYVQRDHHQDGFHARLLRRGHRLRHLHGRRDVPAAPDRDRDRRRGRGRHADHHDQRRPGRLHRAGRRYGGRHHRGHRRAGQRHDPAGSVLRLSAERGSWPPPAPPG